MIYPKEILVTYLTPKTSYWQTTTFSVLNKSLGSPSDISSPLPRGSSSAPSPSWSSSSLSRSSSSESLSSSSSSSISSLISSSESEESFGPSNCCILAFLGTAPSDLLDTGLGCIITSGKPWNDEFGEDDESSCPLSFSSFSIQIF